MDIESSDRPCTVDGQALASMLVDEWEDAETAAILGLVFDEIPAPHLPRTLRTLPLRCREPQPAHTALAFADLKPFLASDPRHSLGVNLEALPPH
jgi:hypothetical protein